MYTWDFSYCANLILFHIHTTCSDKYSYIAAKSQDDIFAAARNKYEKKIQMDLKYVAIHKPICYWFSEPEPP